MRTEYWGTPARQGRRLKGNRPEDYLFRAAQALGLGKGTIQRAIDGKQLYPAKWERPPLTREEILLAVDKAKIDLKRAQERFDAKLPQRAMFKHEPGLKKPPLTEMLTGRTYKRAGGPTSPVPQVAEALDALEDEEFEEL